MYHEFSICRLVVFLNWSWFLFGLQQMSIQLLVGSSLYPCFWEIYSSSQILISSISAYYQLQSQICETNYSLSVSLLKETYPRPPRCSPISLDGPSSKMVSTSPLKIVTNVLSICRSFPLLNPFLVIVQYTFFYEKFDTIALSCHSETKEKNSVFLLEIFCNPISTLQVLHYNMWCQTHVSFDPHTFCSYLFHITSCVALIFAICEVMSPLSPPLRSFWLLLEGPTTKMLLTFQYGIVTNVLSICSSFPLLNPFLVIVQYTFSIGKVIIISLTISTTPYFSPCEALIFAICGVMSFFLTFYKIPSIRIRECAPSFSCFVLPCLFVSQHQKLPLIGF